MFLKVFKYDFKQLMKIMVFIYIPLLVVSFITGLLAKVTAGSVYALLAELLVVLFNLFISLTMEAALILCMVRYYRTMLGDQGYLTHTLPINKWVLVLSKITVTLAVELVTTLVIGVGYIFYSFFDFNLLANTIRSVFSFISEITPGFVASIVLLYLLVPIHQVTSLAMCLSLGGMHNKNKGILGIVYYIALNFAIGIVGGIIFISFLSGIVNAEVMIVPENLVTFLIVIVDIFAFILLVIEYVVTVIILKKRLNLQ